MAFEVGLVQTPEQREAAYAVRLKVFVEEQKVPVEEELDHYDQDATHFIVRRSGGGDDVLSIVGTARLVEYGQSTGKVGRVAILSEYRGLGLGALLMNYIDQTAKAQGFTRLVLGAQCYAVAFYEKLGYVAEGDVYLDCNIEHRFMSKEI